MDWIGLLKAQQVDFLVRVKKPKTYDLSLLESQAKGCHSEVITFFSESLTSWRDISRQGAEILAKNPPPTPSEYPEPGEWSMPFPKYFQQQAEDYLLREQVVDRIISDRLGKLVKRVPQDTVKNIDLDDEGNLRGESKFSYQLADNRNVSIQVYAADRESFNSLKKDKVRWTVTQEDLKNHQVLIFLCLLGPCTTSRGYEKQTVFSGFLPANQVEFSEPKIYITPSSLLYGGGLSWYLKSLVTKTDVPSSDGMVFERIQTLPAEHSLKDVVGDWECWQTLGGHTRGINCLAYFPGGESDKISIPPIVASGSRGETKLWDLSSCDLIGTLSEHPWVTSGLVDEVNSLTLSPDGQTLVSGGADSTIKIWHVGAKDLIDILHKHNGMVRCVEFTPDGRMLATGGDDRKILFWDLMQRQVCMTLSLDDTAAHSMTFSQDGQILVTGSYRKIKVWGLSPGVGLLTCEPELLHSLTGHTHIVRSLAVSSDSKLLVSGCGDKTIKIWNLETGELIRTLTGHRDGVYAIALSPDDKIIASGSADKTIKLWYAKTGELLGTFVGHANTITAVKFSTSGEILVSGSLDKTIKIWQRS
ncbi:MAG: WD40 repeat domain-containing protein [Cyanomargarita calcarea GSE-NOS-MK-12-04C]|jgi:WD40 repeat protein|uniref:WD40 repeat domain-containing protein n=1 Tax=Cyanomargarita calcarea GSE-NOS-MK-12-04C TaxID=2839659 RepID=A0A951UVN9_9CYAN|nr:WD40 repeat domain-containing protein [Cyanomargarita calcarea GSE-NOS-MK-12-04C]